MDPDERTRKDIRLGGRPSRQESSDQLGFALHARLVELDEGPIFPTRLVGNRPEGLRIGMPVEIAYEDVQQTGMTLPLFKTSD